MDWEFESRSLRWGVWSSSGSWNWGGMVWKQVWIWPCDRGHVNWGAWGFGGGGWARSFVECRRTWSKSMAKGLVRSTRYYMVVGIQYFVLASPQLEMLVWWWL